ncbi:hypothetical protein CONCODRAFT_76717 [Conidiobolus coronatus NRRL 28638]|uniref:Origin recognition complex subunit 4 n=1 Tax=Conidiobolus coronatus (strain ATCC 28846 / CBS 209.66 / NRRL 28638) TaxID=796925 RepID=A0A137PI12_CONC2|nr:hypothetical protein CONCODRAFT_76717 [Conidiobolus coronatus NRRL 28638]|eukprot:KXN74636.1 hypothetical protein CONCODRAFT_76717 [Conidiobolus coronatus NRRL 28638]
MKRSSNNKILTQDELNSVKSHILNKLNNTTTSSTDILGLEDQYKVLQNLIKISLINKENNSLLLVGPKGSGKSLLLNSILSEYTSSRVSEEQILENFGEKNNRKRAKKGEFRIKIDKVVKVLDADGNSYDSDDDETEYNSDIESLAQPSTISANFKIVRLNGLIQTSDKLALREILKQLQLDDKLNTINSSLINLINNDNENDDDSEDEDLVELTKLNKLNEELELKAKKGTVLFVLENFEKFTHINKQTLLYNLFDLVQGSNHISLSVIGLTSRIDVLNLMEKRVKSRFSHKLIYTYPLSKPLYKKLFFNWLNLSDLQIEPFYKELFKDCIKELEFNDKLIDYLNELYEISPDPNKLINLIFALVSKLSTNSPLPTIEKLNPLLSPEDPNFVIVKGLTNLELYLLVSMKKLSELGYDWVNFEMIYDTYQRRSNQTTGAIDKIILFDKNSSLKCIDQFLQLGLIKLQSTQSLTDTTLISKQFRYFRLILDPYEIPAYLSKLTSCPSNIIKWVNNK